MNKLLLLLLPLLLLAAAVTRKDDDYERAFANAKKGVQWGLTNLKIKKSRLENKLISDDRLISTVKVEKEINGIKISAVGYDGTTEVSITAYRSFETLLKEGCIDKNFLPKEDD